MEQRATPKFGLHTQLTVLDMMKLFWVTSKKPSVYRRSGIEITVGKKSYPFEVYDHTGAVDIDFRDRYTGSSFYIQYDPDQLDNYVRLYLSLPNGDMRYVADAQALKKVKPISVLMDDHDKARFQKMYKVRDVELERMQQELEILRQETGLTEEALIENQELSVKFKGQMPKADRELVESSAASWLSKL